MKIYLVCPITNATTEQKKKMEEYVLSLEKEGIDVFYPPWDNPYEDQDPIGNLICSANRKAIMEANEVHLFWDKNKKSPGSFFDLGIAYALSKPLVIANPEDIEPNETTSWENIFCMWSFDSERWEE